MNNNFLDNKVGKSIIDNFKLFITHNDDFSSHLRCIVISNHTEDSLITFLTYTPFFDESYLNKLRTLFINENKFIVNEDVESFAEHPITEYLWDLIGILKFNKEYIGYQKESNFSPCNEADIVNIWRKKIEEKYSLDVHLKRFILKLLKYIDPKFHEEVKGYFVESFNLPYEFVNQFIYNGLEIHIGWNETFDNDLGCYIHINDIVSENGICVSKNDIPDFYPNKQIVDFTIINRLRKLVHFKNLIIEPQVFEKLKLSTSIRISERYILRFFTKADSFLYNNNINGFEDGRYKSKIFTRLESYYYRCIVCDPNINLEDDPIVTGILARKIGVNWICSENRNGPFGLLKYLDKSNHSLYFDFKQIVGIHNNAFANCKSLKRINFKSALKFISPFALSSEYYGYYINCDVITLDINLFKRNFFIKYTNLEKNMNNSHRYSGLWGRKPEADGEKYIYKLSPIKSPIVSTFFAYDEDRDDIALNNLTSLSDDELII